MLKKSRYLKKIIISYFAFIAVLTCIFMGVFFNQQRKSTENSVVNVVEQLTIKAVSQYNKILNDMSKISFGISSSDTTVDILKKAQGDGSDQNYFDTHTNDRKNLQKEIIGINGYDFKKKAVYIVSTNYDYMNTDIYETKLFTKDEISKMKWLKEMKEKKLLKCITPIELDAFGRSKEEVFSFIRIIRDAYGTYGYANVQYQKSILDEIFRMSIDDYDINVIVTYQNEIFYTTKNAPIKYINSMISPDKADKEITTERNVHIDGHSYTICSEAINDYDMKVYMVVNNQDYYEKLTKNLLYIALISVVILFFVLILIYLVTLNLYLPIVKLRDSIKRVDYSDLSINMDLGNTNNEIILLSNAFENLLHEVKRKNTELHEMSILELKARYQVMQAQVNPHFMHNILSVIGFMGYQKGAPEIMDICSHLTRMMYYNVESGNSIVNISREFEHANSYLILMKYRYMDMLQYEISMDESIAVCEMPKFILQPVVENCFQHGFADSSKEKYIITIRGTVLEDGWQIVVEDNGTGFTADALQKLRDNFEQIESNIYKTGKSQESQIGGLGLINIFARLLIFSDKRIEMKISNNNLHGAKVEIVYRKEEEL